MIENKLTRIAMLERKIELIREQQREIQREIGMATKLARINARLGSLTVSRRMGVSHAYLSNLEAGRNNWSPTLAEKVRRAIAA